MYFEPTGAIAGGDRASRQTCFAEEFCADRHGVPHGGPAIRPSRDPWTHSHELRARHSGRRLCRTAITKTGTELAMPSEPNFPPVADSGDPVEDFTPEVN